MVRSSLTADTPETLLQQGLLRMVLGPMRAALPAEEADRRVQLVISQMLGLVVTRYLLAPRAARLDARRATSSPGSRPNIQRYLDGPLP